MVKEKNKEFSCLLLNNGVCGGVKRLIWKLPRMIYNSGLAGETSKIPGGGLCVN